MPVVVMRFTELIRFQAAGCFNETMIAGEEADLCLRLRQLGFSPDAAG